MTSRYPHALGGAGRPRTTRRTATKETMSAFSEAELAYLRGERRLGRLATVGKDGTPHVAPVGWSYNEELDTIDIGGRNFETSKKYRDVQRGERAAVVIDDL